MANKITEAREHLVETGRHGRVLVITMRRAAKRNAINRAMADALDAALDESDDDDELWAGVLTGTAQVLSAGSDLTARRRLRHRTGRRVRHRQACAAQAADRRRRRPGTRRRVGDRVVVRHGGGGDDGAVWPAGGRHQCRADVCRAVPRSPCVAAQSGEGAHPHRRSDHAERGHHAGFVNVLIEPGAAVDAAIALAQRICANAPLSVQACLAAVNGLIAIGDEAGWRHTDQTKSTILGSDDAAEGVRSFLEKRSPRWTAR